MPNFSTLTDDFSAGTLGSVWSGSSGTTVVDGRAQIASAATWPTLASTRTFSLVGNAILAEVTPAPGTGSTAEVYTQIMVEGVTDGDRLVFDYDPVGNTFRLGNDVGWWDTTATTIPYDAPTMKWLRFRESGGTVHFETSGNGTTWATRKSVPLPTWATGSNLRFAVQAYQDAGTSMAYVDNVNLAPATTPPPAAPKSYRRGVVLAGGEYGDNGSAYGDAGAVGGLTYSNPGTYGDDYLYPAAADLTYLSQRMPNAVGKLMVRMERLTSAPGGALRPVEITRITSVLDGAQAAGVGIILNPWNFGSIWTDNGSGTSVRNPIGGAVFTQAVFNDFWIRVMNQWGNHPALIGVELMTEPVDLPGGAAAWEAVCQSALNAIRTVSSSMFVWVPNYGWSIHEINLHPKPWITDATGNFGYTGHQYNYNRGGSQTNYADALQSAVSQGFTAGAETDALHAREVKSAHDWATWLGTHKGFMSEYGFPQAEHAATTEASKWLAFAERLLTEYDTQGWWGTIWTAGRVLTPQTLYTVYYPSGGYNTAVNAGTSMAAVVEAHPSKVAALGISSMKVFLAGLESPVTWSMMKLGAEVAIAWNNPGATPTPTTPIGYRTATVDVNPSIRSYATTSHNNGGTATAKPINRPRQVVAGDLLVLFAIANSGTLANNTTMRPSGFTELGRVVGSPGARIAVFYKVAVASDAGGTINYGSYPTGSDGASLMLAVKNWSGSTANLTYGGSTATNTTMNSPSVVPKTARSLLLNFIASDDDSAARTWGWIPPVSGGAVGYAHNIVPTTELAWASGAVSQEIVTGTTATGVRTWSVNTASTQTTRITASLTIPAGTATKTITQMLSEYTYTGGADGAKTDTIDNSFTDSDGVTSTYHLFAAGLDWTKNVGLMVYTDGSGEYGLLTSTINGPSEYLLDGPNGLINVAKRQNMVLLTPRAPGGPCDDGDGVCWYDHSAAVAGGSPARSPWEKMEWSNELIRWIMTRYNIDRRRMVISGYSSGAQWTTAWWGPKYGSEIMLDGLALAFSYGGQPRVQPKLTAAYKANVEHVWNVGTLDTSYTEPTWDDGVQTGRAWYINNGFAVTDLQLVQGQDHERDVVVNGVETADFGEILEREIIARVIPA